MAVTPNYNWPVPVATDYVKDGWEAISDLGNAIDTTVAGLGGDFVHINTTTFSAQSTVSINNCFSSTYQAYRIIGQFNSPSSDAYLRFRLRASGTDDTSNNYNGMKIRINPGGAASSYGDSGANFVVVTGLDTGYTGRNYSAFIDICDPFTASNTTFSMNNTGVDLDGTLIGILGGNVHGVATSYDGFTMYTSAGTVSGTIRVYGYANS